MTSPENLLDILQPIKVEISPGKVEMAVLHIAEMGASIEDLRIKAQHHRNPFHTFMFNRDGILLSANKSAMQACKKSIAGEACLRPCCFSACAVVFLQMYCLMFLISRTNSR